MAQQSAMRWIFFRLNAFASRLSRIHRVFVPVALFPSPRKLLSNRGARELLRVTRRILWGFEIPNLLACPELKTGVVG
jgi:hypothetical protein